MVRLENKAARFRRGDLERAFMRGQGLIQGGAQQPRLDHPAKRDGSAVLDRSVIRREAEPVT